jgi:hypothetical protein
MKRFWWSLATLWCKWIHPAPMWPSQGYYRCPKCLRLYPVPWDPPQKQVYPEWTPARNSASIQTGNTWNNAGNFTHNSEEAGLVAVPRT